MAAQRFARGDTVAHAAMLPPMGLVPQCFSRLQKTLHPTARKMQVLLFNVCESIFQHKYNLSPPKKNRTMG